MLQANQHYSEAENALTELYYKACGRHRDALDEVQMQDLFESLGVSYDRYEIEKALGTISGTMSRESFIEFMLAALWSAFLEESNDEGRTVEFDGVGIDEEDAVERLGLLRALRRVGVNSGILKSELAIELAEVMGHEGSMATLQYPSSTSVPLQLKSKDDGDGISFVQFIDLTGIGFAV